MEGMSSPRFAGGNSSNRLPPGRSADSARRKSLISQTFPNVKEALPSLFGLRIEHGRRRNAARFAGARPHSIVLPHLAM